MASLDCCWSLRSASKITTNMVDEVTRKVAVALQAVNFRTALVSTLTIMGLEQLKPKQVREYSILEIININTYRS